MISYTSVDSPFGPLLVAASEEGVIRVGFPGEPSDDILAELADPGGFEPRPVDLPEIRQRFAEYFAGDRKDFELPVDLSTIATPFTKAVLGATARIPYGTTSTYSEVAARAGAPRGARAAGNALHVNPVPFIVPCHRVILSNGELGGYAGREDRKAALLTLEGSL